MGGGFLFISLTFLNGNVTDQYNFILLSDVKHTYLIIACCLQIVISVCFLLNLYLEGSVAAGMLQLPYVLPFLLSDQQILHLSRLSNVTNYSDTFDYSLFEPFLCFFILFV